MSDLIETFRNLHFQFGSARDWDKPYFRQANIDMFHLAQAICTLYHPLIQVELDKQRKLIVEEFAAQTLKGKWLAGASIMAPQGMGQPISRKQMIWSDFQITPEISCDPNLTGRVINRALTYKLNKLLRKQTTTVRRLVGI